MREGIHPISSKSLPPTPDSLGKHRRQPSVARHVVLPWQPSVVERMHVNHGVCLHHDGWLGFVFNPPLAGERDPDLIGHGAAEGSLGKRGGKGVCYSQEGVLTTVRAGGQHTSYAPICTVVCEPFVAPLCTWVRFPLQYIESG